VLHEILSIEELENLYNNYATEITLQKSDALKSLPPQHLQTLARKRNKIIVGLLVYQAVRSEEILKMQTGDVKLREGKICIAGTRRSNERTLKLESHQVFDLLDYINDTRKQILHHRNITAATQELFLQLGEGKNKSNLLSMLVTHLKQMNSKVKSIDQIRASVIVHWLKLYNLRKVQIMAGHRYISSTENYKANNLDDLKEDIKNFHPF
jgi:integrase/recombinase XerD